MNADLSQTPGYLHKFMSRLPAAREHDHVTPVAITSTLEEGQVSTWRFCCPHDNIKMRLHQVLTPLMASLPTILAATQMPLADPSLRINGVSFETRAHWMRLANQALGDLSGSPCPFAAFGTVIVNHTNSATGELICMGVNENGKTGNPSLHGQTLFNTI